MRRKNIEFVTFQEEGHKYFNEKSEQYISCTTIIGTYKPPYDIPYWSLYKAIERVLELTWEGAFKEYKADVGGWRCVVDYWSKNPFMTKEILEAQETIKVEWEENKERACVKGTAEHLKRELEILKHRTLKGKSIQTLTKDLDVIQDTQSKASTIMNFRPRNAIYTEALVWNDTYKIAGQVDYVEQDGIYLDIKDYKTNKKIDMTSFDNQKMLHPLGHIPDCHFYHYQLQMSLYGWMMEQEGYVVRSLELIHLVEGEEDKIIKMDYRPDLIELMVGHYAKKLR